MAARSTFEQPLQLNAGAGIIAEDFGILLGLVWPFLRIFAIPASAMEQDIVKQHLK